MTTTAKLTKLVGFYADPDMQRIIYERDGETPEGNASAYLRRLAVADITASSARPSGVQTDIFERLAALYRPRIVDRLSAVLRRGAVDQPALIERLLLEQTTPRCRPLARIRRYNTHARPAGGTLRDRRSRPTGRKLDAAQSALRAWFV